MFTNDRSGFLTAVLVLAVAALTLAGCGRGNSGGSGGSSPASVAKHSTVAQHADATAAVEALSQQFNGAMVHHQQDQLPALAEKAKKLTASYPAAAAAWTLLGQIDLARGDTQGAFEQFQQSLKLDPAQADVQSLTGSLAMTLDKPAVAKDFFNRAIALKPTRGKFRMELASVYMQQKHYTQARQTLEDALRIDASLDMAHAALADLDANEGRFNDALVEMKRAIDLLPSSADQRRRLYVRKQATLLRENHQPAQALAVLRQLPQRDQFKPGVMHDLALCWRDLGKPALAGAQYEQATLLDPTDAASAARAGYWYLQAHRLTDADRMIHLLRQLNPRSPLLAKLVTQRAKAKDAG